MKFPGLFLSVLLLWSCASTDPFEPVEYTPKTLQYVPHDGFQMSSPEQQGMDSRILLKMVEQYRKTEEKDEEVDIDSIHILRNGYVVADLYFDPLYPYDYPHIIHSCTKSLMSAIMGIAVDQGFIGSVDDSVLSYFPEKDTSQMDPRFKNLTIRDLLTMETGLASRDSFLFAYEGLFEMQKTNDWVQYFINLPVETDSGIRYDYSNMSSFMLSALIKKATGRETLEYAREYLFAPMGIEEVRWEFSPDNIGIGWARMWLKPHDMLKFGLLFLQKGQWGDDQLISESWIKESLTAQSFPKEYHDVPDEEGNKDNDKSKVKWVGYNLFKPFTDGYGYQWWIDKDGYYSAIGTGGQFIIFSPLDDLVVVITSQCSGMGSFFPTKLFFDYILKSIKNDGPLEENPEVLRQIREFQTPPTLTQEQIKISPVPSSVLDYSKQNYKLEENNWAYDNFSFDFDHRVNTIQFCFTTGDSGNICYDVGLDNAYRYTDTEKGTYAAKGHWIDENTLEINYQLIGYSVPGTWIITFEKDGISVIEKGVTGQYTYSGKPL